MCIKEAERAEILGATKYPDAIRSAMSCKAIDDLTNGNVLKGYVPRLGRVGIISAYLSLRDLFGRGWQLANNC